MAKSKSSSKVATPSVIAWRVEAQRRRVWQAQAICPRFRRITKRGAVWLGGLCVFAKYMVRDGRSGRTPGQYRGSA
jgi:hypothetical protein